jgi:hypothetical protein
MTIVWSLMFWKRSDESKNIGIVNKILGVMITIAALG